MKPHTISFFIAVLMFSMPGISGCKKTPAPPKFIAADSTTQPHTEVQVNKKYDSKGNLVMVDSLYMSYYPSYKNDPAFADSIRKEFYRFNDHLSPRGLDNELGKLFYDDSLLANDFFHHDFFLRRYEINDHYFRRMMKRMDSIKNKFYSQEKRKK